MTRPEPDERLPVVIGRPPVVPQARPAPPPAPAAPTGEPAPPPAAAPAPATPAPATPSATQGAVLGASVAAPASAATTVVAAGRAVAAGGFGDPGGRGPSGPTDDGLVPTNGHRPSGRMTRLHTGSHLASHGALAHLAMPVSGSGMVVGVDRRRQPVAVRFFRAEPTRVTLVGGAWAGQFLTFRALAFGARVAVVTTQPTAWHGFGQRSTGRDDLVRVLQAERPLTVPAAAYEPVLIVYDLGLAGPAMAAPLGPWQTQLTILRELDQPGVAAIQDCDMAILQRLGREEAQVAGTALRLPGDTVGFLQMMANDMAALWGSGADRYIWLAQTEVERACTGTPRR